MMHVALKTAQGNFSRFSENSGKNNKHIFRGLTATRSSLDSFNSYSLSYCNCLYLNGAKRFSLINCIFN